MSCGGGGAYPAAVRLRIEAVRLAMMGGANNVPKIAAEIFEFITAGTDVGGLDAPRRPVAVGGGTEAVASREALLQTPLEQVHGLPVRAVSIALLRGARQLGSVVQWSAEECASAIGSAEAAALHAALAAYGLRLGMCTDSVRDWIVTGAA